MIKVHVNNNILYAKVIGQIEKGDFEKSVEPVADHLIAEFGKIRGILIDATDIGGWDDFPALFAHYGFIKAHEHDIYRVALVGDQTWQKLLPGIATLLLDPQIERFDPGLERDAEAWLLEDVFGHTK